MNFREVLLHATPDFCWQTKREIFGLVKLAAGAPGYSFETFNRMLKRAVDLGMFVTKPDRHNTSALPVKQYLRCRENPIDKGSNFGDLL